MFGSLSKDLRTWDCIAIGGAFSLILFLCSITAAAAGREQSVIVSPATENQIVDMFFLDSYHGWAAAGYLRSASFAVLKTNDGGLTWTRIGPKNGLPKYKFFFIDAQRGWALSACEHAGTGSAQFCLLSTTDGGETCAKRSTAPIISGPAFPVDLAFLDDKHGWIVGQSGGLEGAMLLETMNGGQTFSPVKIGDENPEILTRILSDSDGHLCLLGSDIWVSNDRGKTWQTGMPSKEEETRHNYGWGRLVGGRLFPNRRWVALDAEGEFFHSTDYGSSWTTATDSLVEQRMSPSDLFADVSFYDESNGCAIQGAFYFYCTSDGGKSWTSHKLTREPKGDVPFGGDLLKEIILLPDGVGWITSFNGFLYQTSDWGKTWVEKDLIATASQGALPAAAGAVLTPKTRR